MSHKCIIIDDEQNSISAIELLLKRYCPQISMVQSFCDSRAGLQFLEQNDIDLVFLDIQMPFMSGIDLLKRIPNPSFHVIFVTAFDQYAIDAIKLSAIDYLLKPIDSELLQQAIAKFMAVNKSENNSEKLDLLLNQFDASDIRKLIVQLKDKTLFLEIKEISHLESESNYTYIFMNNGTRYMTSKTIKSYEEQLDKFGFFRTHQSFLINIQRILEYSKSDNTIALDNGKIIPVSKNKKEGLMTFIRSQSI